MNKTFITGWIRKRKKKARPLSAYSKQAFWQIMMQYTLSLILLPVIYIALFVIFYSAYMVYRRITGDTSSPIFWLGRFLGESLSVWMTVGAVAGWFFLTRYFLRKPLLYLDEIVTAAEALTSPTSAALQLSPELKNIQDNLNLAREQALRNALLAKKAEQRKNDMLVYLAHDLKTPLTSVIGYLTLLQDEPLISTELRARYTGIALEKAERLEELINEFFDITRFNLTTLTLQPEEISLSRMLEQLVSEFIPILNSMDLTWRTEISPDIHILCDPDKLERVFDNLVRNAVNYSYRNTEIFLSLRRQENQVVIQVQNSGKTIPADKLARIFDQFFRLDSSRSSATGGAGLGLAISKEIVELHGGTIAAASSDNHILFTVTLPAGNQETDPAVISQFPHR